MRVHILLLALAAGLCASQSSPGPQFPFFDNCRHSAAHQLRNVTILPRQAGNNGTAQFCFLINVLTSPCTPEVFYEGQTRVVARCCNTTFTKIKFHSNAACKLQFLPSALTVPLAPQYSKVVSPNWDYLNASQLNYTAVKYTEFGPVPQALVNGTTFCLTIAAPTGAPGSTCSNSNLAGIANPVDKTHGQFMLAIYDKKTNNYECCPTFSFSNALTS